MKNIALALLTAASLSACTIVPANYEVYNPGVVYVSTPIYAPTPVIMYRPYHYRCWRCY